MIYPAVVGAVRMFPFVLVQGDDDGVTEILWEFALLPAADKEFVEFDIECWSPFSKLLVGCHQFMQLLLVASSLVNITKINK